MRLHLSRPTALIGLAATAILLSGCATGGAVGEAADDRLSVVASTNVYGDIALAITGDLASVTSIITSAAQDPHSYEASAQDQLALSKADLVIENGAGYDPFIDTLLEASGSQAVVINATEASGLLGNDSAGEEQGEEHGDEHAGEEAPEGDGDKHIEGFNEHLWYSFHGMEALAAEIAHELGALDPANAAGYDSNYEAFAAELEELETRAAGLRAQFEGTGAAITEPVPLYLFAEIGLKNLTPAPFSEAVEEGTDVPPLVLQEMLAVIADGSISLLAFNEQTAGPETQRVLSAAEEAGVAVVSFSETLPEGADYVSWMSDNLLAIEAALG